MKRAKIGTIIEIPLGKDRLAYAQISHRHGKWGYLIRVFSQQYDVRPADLECVASGPVQFSTFYPVPSSVKLGLVSIVGEAAVTQANASFPIFKDGVENPQTGRVGVWWLWDGEKEWRVGDLRLDQAHYPFREIITGDVLTKRIQSGWTSDKPQAS